MQQISSWLSPVTPTDRPLVDALCASPGAPPSCGNHWFAYRCACRRGWWKYWDGETFLSVTLCPGGGVAFVRPLGSWKPDTVARLARECVRAGEARVVVKNISPEQFLDLCDYGFGGYRAGDGWDGRYPRDEEAFPEVVIDAEGFRARYAATCAYQAELHPENPFPPLPVPAPQAVGPRPDGEGLGEQPGGAAPHGVRPAFVCPGGPYGRKFRGALLKGASLRLSVEALDVDRHRQDMEGVIRAWAGDYVQRPHAKESFQDLVYVYTSFVFETGGGGWLFRRGERPVGFVRHAPGMDDDTLDFHAAPYDPGLKAGGLHPAMYAIGLHLAAGAGYRYVGVGGSELGELFRFKQNFTPQRLIPREHAVLYAD